MRRSPASGERLFTRLYHEAFHAYLGTFVYPAQGGSLPIWFNEGLAQIFETAIVEVGELRVGHADPVRLVAVRAVLGSPRSERRAAAADRPAAVGRRSSSRSPTAATSRCPTATTWPRGRWRST